MTDGPVIGILQESSLHRQLKDRYVEEEDSIETPVDGFIVDVLKKDMIVEVQTKSFYAIRKKLRTLVKDHPILLVYPAIVNKWIVKETLDGKHQLSKRKSPKRGTSYDLFTELVSIPKLLIHENLTIDVVQVHVQEVRRKDGKGSWRRKGWSIIDTVLLEIVGKTRYSSPNDLLTFLPTDLPEEFTNKDLATVARIPRFIAEKTTYCLRKMGVVDVIGNQGRARLHAISKKSM